MKEHYAVVINGGGQAGLSMSYHLKQAGVDHIVFEKAMIADSWRSKRWDTFCLVTPNWQCQLPGYPYTGSDPHGFMLRDEIVEFVQSYAYSFEPPIREGVEVLKLTAYGSDPVRASASFQITTSIGECTADQVVVATGGYHDPQIPRLAERFPSRILQLHSSQYKNPGSLPEGDVLVVGTGQSGCQIAEDLHLAGRQVHLCVGSAPRAPRVYRGKDVVDWLDEMGYYNLPIDQHPQKEAVRSKTNHYVSGRNGGHEINLRQFALEGMKLYGRLASVQDCHLQFNDDLKANLDQADGVAESIKQTIDDFIVKNQIEAPQDPPYQPVWEPQDPVQELELTASSVSSVIWCTGYTMNFRWVDLPVFNGKGYPTHQRGVTSIKGFYVLGLPWLYTWGSGRFSGIAQDAKYLADVVLSSLPSSVPTGLPSVNQMAIGS